MFARLACLEQKARNWSQDACVFVFLDWYKVILLLYK